MSKESNEHHFISIENAERIAEEYATQQSEDMAVRFAEWIYENNWSYLGENKLWSKMGSNNSDGLLTSQQLFTKFQNPQDEKD